MTHLDLVRDLAARTQLVSLDRALARLLERRARLLERAGLDAAALARQHADLAARARGRVGAPDLLAAFAALNALCGVRPTDGEVRP